MDKTDRFMEAMSDIALLIKETVEAYGMEDDAFFCYTFAVEKEEDEIDTLLNSILGPEEDEEEVSMRCGYACNINTDEGMDSMLGIIEQCYEASKGESGEQYPGFGLN